jgi:hypothetical protein
MSRRVFLPFGAFLAALVLANLSLLTPPGESLRVLGAMALLLLPGLVWAEAATGGADRLLRWVVGLGLSFALVSCLALLLHYMPGAVPVWAEVVALDLLTLAPLLTRAVQSRRSPLPVSSPLVGVDTAAAGSARLMPLLLLLIMAAAVFFRFADLGASEFQGDEALAMISAAEALEGHEDALFLRGKGPGEVLLPMGLWRLTGTIDEATARLPFALAGALMPLTGFLLAVNLFQAHRSGITAGLATAALLALNGFMVAFSRIVQYQALVVWMSGLALLCAWMWRRDGRTRWLTLCGIFLGSGLLAHYDALLVTPALAYVVGSAWLRQRPSGTRTVVPVLIGAACLLVVAGLFYGPYLLDPQAARTGGYLGDRIGDAPIKNNLDSFQRFNAFYTSFYYYALSALLVLGWLACACRGTYGLRRLAGAPVWVPLLLAAAVLVVGVWPSVLQLPSFDLTFLPFALILLGALLSASLDEGRRAAVLWLAVPFLGYNFGVALPLTHIYTVVPGWTLLAGLAIAGVAERISGLEAGGLRRKRLVPWAAAAVASAVAIVSAGYLTLVYLHPDGDIRRDWPRSSQPALTWAPYAEPPPTGFFGLPHRAGWKAVGALYADGRLQGDYGSNEEPDVTAWYTRGAARACDTQPEYYFLVPAPVDAWPVDMSVVEAGYDAIGKVAPQAGQGLTIYQARPSADAFGSLDSEVLRWAFDGPATPAAFVRPTRGGQATDVNLGGLVRLVGYDVDTRRAHPGGRLAVTLYWQALARTTEDYHVFVHLEDSEMWGQADGRPACWTYPTQDWRPGQVIADHHALTIRPDTPPGEHPLVVGMYLPTDGRRLDVLDAAGNAVSNQVPLTSVLVLPAYNGYRPISHAVSSMAR